MSDVGEGGAEMTAVAALREEGWERLLARARERLEQGGGSLEGRIGIPHPTEAERRRIIGLTGQHRHHDAARLELSLGRLDEAVRRRTGLGLVEALALLDGRPVRDRPAERRAEAERRAALVERIGRGRHAGAPWYRAWCDGLLADGTLTRLVRSGDEWTIEAAVRVLDHLPARDVPLPVLAERATGRTKALSEGAVAGLTLRALALREGVPAPESAAERRALWDGAGVIVDDLASQVLVLNLRAEGSWLGRELTAAAERGTPRRLTLYELVATPADWHLGVVYVCENPAVLRSAVAALGRACLPLVCTEGEASEACLRLLRAVRQGGGRIRWHNDFDWPGVRMTQTALGRLGAEPWRMGVDDYRAGLARAGERLKGTPRETAWEPSLAAAMAASGLAVMEEQLVPTLLADLSGG